MSNENQTPNEIQELTEEELRDFLIQNITSFENILKDIQSTNLRILNTNVFGANDDSFVKELDEEFGSFQNPDTLSSFFQIPTTFLSGIWNSIEGIKIGSCSLGVICSYES